MPNKQEIDENPNRENGSFNLLRVLTPYSLGAIILTTVVLILIFMDFQKRTIVRYSISSAEHAAQQLYDRIPKQYIFRSIKRGGNFWTKEDQKLHEQLEKETAHFLADYSDIVKVKIFAMSGLTLYSTDEKNVGVYNTSPKLQKALRGTIGSKLTRSRKALTEDSTEKGSKYEIDLLEVYIPIYKESDVTKTGFQKDIIGAFEIYKDMSSIAGIIDRQKNELTLYLFLSMVVLFLIFHLILRKAQNLLIKKHVEFESGNKKLEGAYHKISDSMNEVIDHESFNIRFRSDKLLKCWEFKGCEKTDCPSYKSRNLRCWQVAGTYCGKKPQGVFAQKYGDCRKCEVYKYAFKDRMSKIGESFNNMMALLENKHSEMKRLNQKLNDVADIDYLMQIGNRRNFHKRIQHIHQLALRYNRYYSVVICDIDNFKLYNDTYGHMEGDNVLISVANIFKNTLRKTDEIFRFGGEEIIVILPEQNLSSTVKVAEHLRYVVQELGIEHKKNEPPVVTISCGVSSFCPGNNSQISWEYVLKKADELLYKAKKEQKNRVCSAVDVFI
jgi:diguanylate cyclase (GGDEF)-like protein